MYVSIEANEKVRWNDKRRQSLWTHNDFTTVHARFFGEAILIYVRTPFSASKKTEKSSVFPNEKSRPHYCSPKREGPF